MADPKRTQQREGLSLQTLVIAAIASGTAAILTSHFWKAGTAFAAAMTPVIVAILKELLAKPIESDLVRKPVKMAASAIAAPGQPRTRERRFERPPAREPVGARSGRLPSQPPPEIPLGDDGTTPEGLTPGDVVLTHPRRTYGRDRKPLRLKLAIVTGLLAFAVAVVVLTVPELVFGGAVASHHNTTFFGGGSHRSKSSDNGSSSDKGNQGGSSNGSSGQQQT